jgi:PAS domain S-box-containing protein
MRTSLDTEKQNKLNTADVGLQAEVLLLEKEQQLAHLRSENQTLQQRLSALDTLEKELRYVYEVVNNVEDIIFITDSVGNFNFINPAAEKLLGFPRLEMLGKHFSELILPDYADLVRDQYRDEIRNGVASSYLEFPVKNIWQKELWLGQQVSFIYRDGKFFEAHSISRDITAQVQARKDLNTTYSRLKGLVQNLHAGVLVEDENRKIVLSNQQFCDLFGIPVAPEYMLGADCAQAAEQSKDLFADPDDFVQGVARLLQNRKLCLNESLRMADGRSLERHYIPVFSGDSFLGHMWHYLDVSEQKNLQADLQRARFEAEQAREAEKAFLANMSHEIRNPINSIVGMTNLLYDTPLNKEQLEYVNTLKYSADLLHALVSDVLDISKIDQGKMEPQLSDFEFLELVQALCKTFAFRLIERAIQFNCSIQPQIPARLHSDPTFVNQILLNLLSNAFKFTEQGQIDFAVRTVVEQEQNWLEFTIQDTGVGIEAERIPFIFERFNQAGKPNKGYQDGTGLGLPITKQLVDLLGGSIQVNSTLNQGTIFQVRLPFVLAKDALVDAATLDLSTAPGTSRLLKTLIVEDNPMNRLYLENLLVKWGLEYTSAEDGLVALQLTEQEQYDLILMDIRMPNLDGYDTTLRLRNSAKNPNQNVPIIALTASALLDEKEKAMQAGMNQHLAKPFTPDQLQEVFRQFFPGFSPAVLTNLPTALNREEMEELYENDRVYMREIFEIFVDTTPAELAQMRQTLQTEDWKALAARAHKIKPSFQMVGLGYLGTKAEALEQMAQQNPDIIPEIFEKFAVEVLYGVKLVERELEHWA